MSGIETAFFGALAADAEQKSPRPTGAISAFASASAMATAHNGCRSCASTRRRFESRDQMTKGARVYVEGRTRDQRMERPGRRPAPRIVMPELAHKARPDRPPQAQARARGTAPRNTAESTRSLTTASHSRACTH